MFKKDTIADLATYIWEDLKKSRKVEYRMPPSGILEQLFDVLYFASMNSEEGELIKVRVAFYNPGIPEGYRTGKNIERFNYIPFGEPRPYDIKSVVKLSKSADPWSSSLAVYFDNDNQLKIYGLIDQAVHSESFFNRETSMKPEQAGFFQVAIIGIGSLSVIREYDLVATFKQNVLVTQFLDVLRFGPVALLLKDKAKSFETAVLKFIKDNEFDTSDKNYDNRIHIAWRDTLARILIHIRNYGHGGAFVISNQTKGLKINFPIEYDRLSNSILRLVKSTIADDFVREEISELTGKKLDRQLFNEYYVGTVRKKSAQNELKGAIRFVASHSCVDGLILFDDTLCENGYGVVVEEINTPDLIYQAMDNIANESKLEPRNPKQFGTRHQSMITFCYANEGALGFVVSQDGDIRAFTKVGDKLIMWDSINTHKYVKSSPGRRLPPSRLKSL